MEQSPKAVWRAVMKRTNRMDAPGLLAFVEAAATSSVSTIHD
jgi:hypothetical protein